MRKAFTLLELLTAVSIMALLGVAASNGYRALAKGVRERSALSAASAALRAARERAKTDRVPTVVYCYNRLVRKGNVNSDENAEVVGVITAIRTAGRITGVNGDLLYDEFADLDRVYEGLNELADCKTHKGLRLFRMPAGSGNPQMEYSIVSDAVYRDDTKTAYLPSDGVEPGQSNLTIPAFVNLHRSKHEPTWGVGAQYGLEFLEIELPKGFIFGSQIPTELGEPVLVKSAGFDPDSSGNESVEVSFAQPDDSGDLKVDHKVGDAKSDNDNV